VRQVLEILPYSYPKFPVLWGRRVESKTPNGGEGGAQTIWGLGSFAPARYGGNNQKCGKRENSQQEGLECKKTENGGFSL